jgi:hypothetical protein
MSEQTNPDDAEVRATSSRNEEPEAQSTHTDALACGVCGWVLAVAEDVVLDRASGLKTESVYAYELEDVCGHDKVWTYSATNPSANRFDVIRVKPTVAERSSIILGGVFPTPEYSWFPPFAWNMAECVSCGAHLGWGFYDTARLRSKASSKAPKRRTIAKSSSPESHAVDEEDDVRTSQESPAATSPSPTLPGGEEDGGDGGDSPSASSSPDQREDGGATRRLIDHPSADGPVFVGLILTHCTAVEARDANKPRIVLPTRAENVGMRARHEEYQTLHGEIIGVLRLHPNRRAANELAMVLYNIDQRPADRGNMIHQLAAIARALRAGGGDVVIRVEPLAPAAAHGNDGDNDDEWEDVDDDEEDNDEER